VPENARSSLRANRCARRPNTCEVSRARALAFEMEAANAKCAKIKQVYENCFRDWYAEQFMKGDVRPACQDEFEEYRECVILAMKERGTDKLVSKDDMPQKQ